MTVRETDPSRTWIGGRIVRKAKAVYNRLKCWFFGHAGWIEIRSTPISKTAVCPRCGQKRFAHTVGGKPYPDELMGSEER